MSDYLTIAAADVVVGDEIYNRYAYHSTAAWVRVTAVETPDDATVILRTLVFETRAHPREAVAVRRRQQLPPTASTPIPAPSRRRG